MVVARARALLAFMSACFSWVLACPVARNARLSDAACKQTPTVVGIERRELYAAQPARSCTTHDVATRDAMLVSQGAPREADGVRCQQSVGIVCASSKISSGTPAASS